LSASDDTAGVSEQTPPTCYRHVDRETWVRCTRCERPVCPDCMRSASVGFQCPECVSAGARSTREARTVFGGRVSADTSKVSLGFVAANVAIFALGFVLGQDRLRADFGNITGPALLQLGGEIVGVATGEYYRLITAAFLHAGVLHLAFNMFALATVGPPLEAALGRLRFAALYLLSALGGSVTAFVLAPERVLGVGASGAIFGLFGAYYVVVRRLGGNTSSIAILLGINLVITFTVPFIDWRAHVGGLVTGAAVAAALAYAPRGSRRTAVQVAALVGVAALLVVATLVRRASLG
jgi:membrane associated rhomboid family serine protease